MRQLAAVAVVAMSVALSGCGYALAGRGNSLPAYIKIIGVPNFVNQSQQPDLDTVLGEAVRQEFQGKGRYRIVTDATGVDALLTVTLQPVLLTPTEWNAARQASKYVITVSANVTFTDEHDKKVFWANPAFVVREDYLMPNPTAVLDTATLFSSDNNALERLSRNFARSLVTSILEAF
jgi:outer membrane lipopolysaccharide assembly protein LptE/RlpB